MKSLNKPKRNSLGMAWITGCLAASLVLLAMACTQPDKGAESAATEQAAPAKAEVELSRAVHVFYYPWYANQETDGHWDHWNHHVNVPKGQPPRNYPGGDDIGSNFYPKLGSYSMSDPTTLRQHMAWLTRAGVGVISLSWWGVEDHSFSVPKIMEAAAEADIKVNFHLEPFHNGDINVVRENIEYIFKTWGDHPAFYRTEDGQPMFYVYDSYKIPAADWARLLGDDGDLTVRGTDHDGLYLGLWVGEKEEEFMLTGSFDGFYTYFAVDGFTYGSTLANWPKMAAWAKANGLLFVPSVGPGYDDTRIKPWNTGNYRSREDGTYYDRQFQAALDVTPEYISVTSFNEWGEGTVIEPAVPKTIPTFTYSDFAPHEPEYYLDATKKWGDKFEAMVGSN